MLSDKLHIAYVLVHPKSEVGNPQYINVCGGVCYTGFVRVDSIFNAALYNDESNARCDARTVRSWENFKPDIYKVTVTVEHEKVSNA